MTHQQPDAGPSDGRVAGQPPAPQDTAPLVAAADAVEPSPRDQEFRQATQALVESSNRALRQFSEKVSRQDQELSELRARLQSVSQQLTAEREQRIAAEAQLAALTPREAPRPGPRPRPITLAALGGGLLAGALAMLALQPRWWAGRLAAPLSTSGLEPLAAPPAAASAGQQDDTLHLRCEQPCWLKARDLGSGGTLVEKTMSGSISLPLGRGLEVFTGRGDLMLVRLNDGPETRFSRSPVVQRRFLPQ